MAAARCTSKAGVTCSSSTHTAPLRACVLHPVKLLHTTSYHTLNSLSARQHVQLVCRAASSDSSSQFDVDAPKSNEPREDLGPRDDEVLPEDLADSIRQAALATAEAIQRGNSRCQVEILLPEFWDPISGPIFPNRGDQDRFWRITRRFVEQLGAELRLDPATVNAVYPDAGVAALLKHKWSAAGSQAEDGGAAAAPVEFRLSSLNDRRPIKSEDALVIMACPDPPGADDALKVVRMVSQQDEDAGQPYRPVVLFNQRLSSGDVGLGLNSRRLRDQFLKNFAVTYSLRPIGEIGTVFRRYPGLWKVFIEDPELPGRYKLIAEQPSRPQGEYLDYLVQQAINPQAAAGGEGQQSASLGSQLARTFNSLQYFMKSLTK